MENIKDACDERDVHSVRGGIMRYSIFSLRGGHKLDTKLAGVFLVSAKKGGSFIPEISFRDDGNVESHSVRGGIMRYSIFSPGAGRI